MGSVRNITFDSFPEQGSYTGREAVVRFHYDTSNRVRGVVVRDDKEAPFITIIKLEDGRHVLSTECQYTVR